jgi:ABC-type transporter Mla maintaining outer membrane lipid asymmetry ATPase subunit MlaF
MESATQITSQPVIEMQGVTVGALRNLDLVVLEDVNWSVRAGEYWVIAGMQGSGKSDLMAFTAGLMPAIAGSYRLFGFDMPLFGEELLAQRLRVGLVFDNGHLLHQLSVKENIALPLRYHREMDWHEAEKRVNTMLELTELTPYADTKPVMLAHHWRKRAGLARALMLEPEVLLVDYPLSGLDFRNAAWVMQFLDQLSAGHEFLNKRPLTLIVTAEDLRPWRDMNCHFAVLKQKRFVPLGRCEKLAGHPEPLVKELLAEGLHATR